MRTGRTGQVIHNPVHSKTVDMSDIDETSSASAYMSAKDPEEDRASGLGNTVVENQEETRQAALPNLPTSSSSSSPPCEKTPAASVVGDTTSRKPTPSLSSAFAGPPPKPRYFAVRDDGSLTPLIAVDELPSYVQIHGVSRTLTAADTNGLISLGPVPKSNSRYILLQILETTHANHIEGLAVKSMRPFASASEVSEIASNVEDSAVGFAPRRIREWVKGQSSGDDKEAPKPKTHLPQRPGGMSYNPTTPGVFGGKIYCTHWVRTGECDFTQQGCIFRHEMPDESMLAQMGFRTIPRWFREAGGYAQNPLGGMNPPQVNEDWRPPPPINNPGPFGPPQYGTPFSTAPQHGNFNNVQPPRAFPPFQPPRQIPGGMNRGFPPPQNVRLGNPSFGQAGRVNNTVWPQFGQSNNNINMPGPLPFGQHGNHVPVPPPFDPRPRGFPVPPSWKPQPPQSNVNRPPQFTAAPTHSSGSSQHRVHTEPETLSSASISTSASASAPASASTPSPRIPTTPLVALSPRAPSAVSGVTNRSSQTMSAFVPHEPNVRAGYTIVPNGNRAKASRVASYKPLAPAAPTTHPLPAKPGFVGQGGGGGKTTGLLYQGSPDTPAPVHQRMFVPPPTVHQPQQHARGGINVNISGPSSSAPVVPKPIGEGKKKELGGGGGGAGVGFSKADEKRKEG